MPTSILTDRQIACIQEVYADAMEATIQLAYWSGTRVGGIGTFMATPDPSRDIPDVPARMIAMSGPTYADEQGADTPLSGALAVIPPDVPDIQAERKTRLDGHFTGYEGHFVIWNGRAYAINKIQRGGIRDTLVLECSEAPPVYQITTTPVPGVILDERYLPILDEQWSPILEEL
jgi:hypothetical protein